MDNKFEKAQEILATKNDIRLLRTEVMEIKAELIKWMFIFLGRAGWSVNRNFGIITLK